MSKPLPTITLEIFNSSAPLREVNEARNLAKGAELLETIGAIDGLILDAVITRQALIYEVESRSRKGKMDVKATLKRLAISLLPNRIVEVEKRHRKRLFDNLVNRFAPYRNPLKAADHAAFFMPYRPVESHNISQRLCTHSCTQAV